FGTEPTPREASRTNGRCRLPCAARTAARPPHRPILPSAAASTGFIRHPPGYTHGDGRKDHPQRSGGFAMVMSTDVAHPRDLLPASADQGAFLERLVQQLGEAGNATRIFGPAIEHDGLKIIPVAQMRWGLG